MYAFKTRKLISNRWNTFIYFYFEQNITYGLILATTSYKILVPLKNWGYQRTPIIWEIKIKKLIKIKHEQEIKIKIYLVEFQQKHFLRENMNPLHG